MEDPWNPSDTEIEHWAFDEEALDPVQDWDLALSWKREEKLYLDLASNEACPKRRYFLHVVYLIVGDAVRNGFKGIDRPIIEGFLDRGEKYDHPDIKNWVERSRGLIANPGTFDYQKWCAGGLASSGST